MKKGLAIGILILAGCNTEINYPTGGFKYPKKILDNDTMFYRYQLKDSFSKLDIFRNYYEHLFYEPFNEPNLSLRPQQKETFRLVISTAKGQNIIITLNEDAVLIKKGNPHLLYTFNDTSRLTSIEKFHLNILNRWYPFDTPGKSPQLKKRLDSLIHLYPQLLDEDYYHKLYEKSFYRNKEDFVYETIYLAITKTQYLQMVNQINLSGFWSLPYQIKCGDGDMADGYGFTLEANTKNKYKTVSSGGCPGDNTLFTIACQRLIELAKTDKEFTLVWRDETRLVTPDN